MRLKLDLYLLPPCVRGWKSPLADPAASIGITCALAAVKEDKGKSNGSPQVLVLTPTFIKQQIQLCF